MATKAKTWRAPYGWDYLRWTSLSLNRRQLFVLHALECQRNATGSIRIYIDDDDPSSPDLPNLLADYLAWLSTRINPHASTLVLDQKLSQARARCRIIPHSHPLATYNPAHTRGHSAQQLLLLNADRYGHNWACNITGRLRQYLFPAVADAPGSVIIIHGHVDHDRNPMFAYEFCLASRGHFGSHWLTLPSFAAVESHLRANPIGKSAPSPSHLISPINHINHPLVYKSVESEGSVKSLTSSTFLRIPHPRILPLHIAAAAAA